MTPEPCDDLDEALTALLDLNGQQVDVQIFDTTSTSVLVTMTGTLRGAIPMSEKEATAEEALCLSLDTDGAPVGLSLDREVYRGAEGHDGVDLTLQLGGVGW